MTKSAIISCGGFGTRLRSVVSDLPKPLALINGRHFIFIFWINYIAQIYIM